MPQSATASTAQVPAGRQHAPTPGVQLATLDHVVRMIQSPLGRQNPGKAENAAQPPLAGQPKDPQLIPKSRLLAEFCSPLVSTQGNALELPGGAVKHGSAVWLLWWSIRNATEN